VTYEVRWSIGAQEALKYLDHWKTAAAICEGVERFARTGHGDLRRFGPDHHLRVAGYIVKITIDPAARTIVVHRFFRDLR
jgi:hypothetical protein